MKRFFVACAGVAMIGALTLTGLASSTRAHAYGPANWQATFSGTGVNPQFGGFGFWGWCDFAGGVSSGNSGDCQFSQYFHQPGGQGLTCEVSMDITSWTASGDFLATGTASANPAKLTPECVGIFPGSTSYTGVDTGIPAAAGHYHFGSILGQVGEFNEQVTQVR